MKKPIIIGTVLLALFVASSLVPLAAAQNPGYGGGSQSTLEEVLKLAKARLAAVQANPHAGSGTPFLDANGVVGASIIAGAVFGGIFVAFVVRAKQAERARRSR
jgi:hypothetical protein